MVQSAEENACVLGGELHAALVAVLDEVALATPARMYLCLDHDFITLHLLGCNDKRTGYLLGVDCEMLIPSSSAPAWHSAGVEPQRHF